MGKVKSKTFKYQNFKMESSSDDSLEWETHQLQGNKSNQKPYSDSMFIPNSRLVKINLEFLRSPVYVWCSQKFSNALKKLNENLEEEYIELEETLQDESKEQIEVAKEAHTMGNAIKDKSSTEIRLLFSTEIQKLTEEIQNQKLNNRFMEVDLWDSHHHSINLYNGRIQGKHFSLLKSLYRN